MANSDIFPSQAGNPSPFTGAAFSTALGGLNWSLNNAPRLLTIDGSSTANALVAACEVDNMSDYVAGQRFKFYPAAVNTGEMTINVNSLGVVAIVDAAGDALTGGEMSVGLHTELDYDGTAMRLVSQPSRSGAGAIDIQSFTSSDTWNRPTGVFQWAEITAIGGGGSGARIGVAANTERTRFGGSGGAAAIVRVPFSELAATETVTVGTGGTEATAGQAGNNGGDTSFGSFVTARGGLGGILRTGSSPIPFQRTEGRSAVIGANAIPIFAEPGGVSAPGVRDDTHAAFEYHAPNTLIAGPGGGTVYSPSNVGSQLHAGIGGINGIGALSGTPDGGDASTATLRAASGYGAGGSGVWTTSQSMNLGTDGFVRVVCS